MANFTDSFLRSFQAVQDIKTAKEDREWRNEERARKRKEYAAEDNLKKTTADALSGVTQKATDGTAAVVNPSALPETPDGLIIADVPGAGMPTEKTPLQNKLVDAVKNKVASIFGGGSESLGTFGVPTEGGAGAAPELTADSTSKQIGATRELTTAERLRAFAAAAAQVDPAQAMQYSKMADAEDVKDKFAGLYRDANTNEGAKKVAAEYGLGDLTWGKRGEDGRREFFIDGESVGAHRHAQELIMERLGPQIANMDPTAILQMIGNRSAREDRAEERQLARQRFEEDRDWRRQSLLLSQQSAELARITNERQGKIGEQQLRVLTDQANRLDEVRGLRDQYDKLLDNPVRNRAQLSEIEGKLAMIDPSEYTTSVPVRDPVTNEVTGYQTISRLQGMREARMPKFRPAVVDGDGKVTSGDEAANAATTLMQAFAVRAKEPDALEKAIDYIEDKHGAGAVDLIREKYPQVDALFKQAEKPTQGAAPAAPAAAPQSAPQWGLPAWGDVMQTFRDTAKAGRKMLGEE